MRILALILARGGSKRLVGKNIRILGSKPLVVWSIDVVKDIPDICDILVSTDDPAIAEVCKEAGAYVPWLRPAELAIDTASSVDAALHALDWYESVHGKIDGLLLLQPTSPFRTKDTVQKGIDLFKSNNQRTVIGISPTHTHPLCTLKLSGDQLHPFFEDNGFEKRSQDLPKAYAVNGCYYLISPKDLRTQKSFIGSSAQPLIIESSEESLDIDTANDWDTAEKIIRSDRDFQEEDNVPTKASHASYATKMYLTENEAAFSLHREIQLYTGKPRKVKSTSLAVHLKHTVGNLLKVPIKYLKEIIPDFEEISRLSSLKGSKKNKKAIVIGNGPSQGLITSDELAKFRDMGNDIYAVNFWNKNKNISDTPPQYLVISDSATLSDTADSGVRDSVAKDNELLVKYLFAYKDIILWVPFRRVRYFKNKFGEHRVLGFIDTEMRGISSNIDPRYPRGYLSMTLYKALACAVFMGYNKVYLIGMDNTYPRDVFCNHENKIFNYERHAGGDDSLVDVSAYIPSMDVWAQDIFELFCDVRKCFSKESVLNLDCYSLTDVFPKISDYNSISNVLCDNDIN